MFRAPMITHRPMSLADLDTALDWAAEEGWNPGREDAAAFLAADPQGFFMAWDAERPVAAISVVNHGPGFAFLGLYLCRPGHRGRGIGYALWQDAIAHAGDRTIGLDGVAEQQGNYAKSGFIRAGGTTRHTGPVPAARSAALRPATPADIPALIAAEARASGVPKPAYLTAWFTNTATRTTWLLETEDGIRAFATARLCRDGAKIGPLVAGTEDEAHGLLAHAAAAYGPDLVLDVPSGAPRLQAVARALDLAPGFQTARMYRGPVPPPGSDLCAPATLELG